MRCAKKLPVLFRKFETYFLHILASRAYFNCFNNGFKTWVPYHFNVYAVI